MQSLSKDQQQKDAESLTQLTTQECSADSGSKFLTCKLCGYSQNRKSQMVIHLRKHTGEKPYKCGCCDYSCSQSSMLNVHMRTHTGERPFICCICLRSFSRKYHLKEHTAVAHGTAVTAKSGL